MTTRSSNVVGSLRRRLRRQSPGATGSDGVVGKEFFVELVLCGYAIATREPYSVVDFSCAGLHHAGRCYGVWVFEQY